VSRISRQSVLNALTPTRIRIDRPSTTAPAVRPHGRVPSEVEGQKSRRGQLLRVDIDLTGGGPESCGWKDLCLSLADRDAKVRVDTRPLGRLMVDVADAERRGRARELGDRSDVLASGRKARAIDRQSAVARYTALPAALSVPMTAAALTQVGELEPGVVGCAIALKFPADSEKLAAHTKTCRSANSLSDAHLNIAGPEPAVLLSRPTRVGQAGQQAGDENQKESSQLACR